MNLPFSRNWVIDIPFAEGPCTTVEARRAPSVEMPALERRIERRRPEKLIVDYNVCWQQPALVSVNKVPRSVAEKTPKYGSIMPR